MKEKKYETQENKIQNNNKQAKKRKNKFLALNCVFGSVMLLGCVGTITFGSLWCQQTHKYHKITCDLDGGYFNKSIVPYTFVLSGTVFKNIPLASPNKENEYFSYWSINNELAYDQVINSDITIKANYGTSLHRIHFAAGSGTRVIYIGQTDFKDVPDGMFFGLINAPTAILQGKTFIGWHYYDTSSAPYTWVDLNFSSRITKDIKFITPKFI